MPVDVESELARLGAVWSESLVHVEVGEVLERATVDPSLPIDDTAGPRTAPRRRMRAERSSPRRSVRSWLVAAACTALVVAGVVAIAQRQARDPEPASSNPVPTPSAPIGSVAPPPPIGPFVGAWVSTDTDGSSQTMEIAYSGIDEYDVVIRDEAATVACAGGGSTLSGAGRLATDTSLVVAEPELTCDDGTVPALGPPPQAELANFTLAVHAATDELVDSLDVVWRRDGSDDEGIVTSSTTVPDSGPLTSGGMWPQSTLDEVRLAQSRADAGDPDYTWQVGTQLTLDDTWENVDELELVDRFLREVLGWEAYLFNSRESGDETGNGEGDGWLGGDLGDLEFLRCVPGRTNPLYPPGPDRRPGTSCAPTLDDLHYESVRLDLAQLDREGLDGIWVVNRWELTAPFVQTDSTSVSTEVTAALEEWLDARIAGEGADGNVRSNGEIPLLYATSAGAPYEWYQIERVDVGLWPDGHDAVFAIHLFADGGATVVEQEITWNPSFGVPPLYVTASRENGQPVARSVWSADGEVTADVPDTWSAGGTPAEGVWTWVVGDGGTSIDFTDPVAYDSWCAGLGGSPVLAAPAGAAAIAQEVGTDPNFEATAPVVARVGGLEAVSIDVALAPDGRAPCGDGFEGSSHPYQVNGRWIHELSVPGRRLRVYLVDLPDGMSVRTMAITVVAPAHRFDEIIAETAAIIDSIEFHPG